ncbi:MAG: hypothetical protein F4Y87_04085, partial [Synechococcus sp. SB0665_bin_28]|nr:hypothetical protein [Synechococcus sp. SB0665_bin_28]MYF19495.1 hypothetical protein [Synechococcus sp. SB0677_bin_5]
MVGEDMKDKVQDGVESKALKMAEERARIAEERARAAEERVESLKGTRKNRKTRLKEEVAREM